MNCNYNSDMSSNKITQQRNSSIELLRIICILFILLMHALPQNDVTAFNKFLRYPINIGNIGVSCFILISGYYGLTFKSFRFIQLILLTTFYSLFTFFLNHGWVLNLTTLKTAFVIPLYSNWFITCYLFLMLLSPYIDIFIINCEEKKFKKLLMILFIGFSLIPTALNTPYYAVVTHGGKCLIYMLFVYMTGRYISIREEKRDRRRETNRKKVLLCFMTLALLACAANYMVGKLFDRDCFIYFLDCSPFIFVMSILTFYYFKSYTFYSKTINYIASSVLAVYLLDGTRLFWNEKLFHLNEFSQDNAMLLLLLLEVSTVFIFAVIIDKIRIALFQSIERKLINSIQTTVRKITNILSPFINKYI